MIDRHHLLVAVSVCFRIVLALLPCTAFVYAQLTGHPLPPSPRTSSARPMLVNVEFEGNEEGDLNDKVLKAQIKSKPTDKPTVRRIFSIFANVYDANPFMPQHMRDEMH